MEIEYQEKSAHVSDQVLLADMQQVAKKLCKTTLTIGEYEKVGTYSASTIARRFGSWNEALKLAEITISNKFYSDSELFNNLAEIWTQIGKQPSRRDLALYKSPISYKAYERRFGKWSEAVKAFVAFANNPSICSFDVDVVATESSRKTARDVNLRLRFQVMQRDCFKCCFCGASPATDPSVVLHVDHIVPWSKGGATASENLQTLCSRCNLGKSNLL